MKSHRKIRRGKKTQDIPEGCNEIRRSQDWCWIGCPLFLSPRADQLCQLHGILPWIVQKIHFFRHVNHYSTYILIEGPTKEKCRIGGFDRKVKSWWKFSGIDYPKGRIIPCNTFPLIQSRRFNYCWLYTLGLHFLILSHYGFAILRMYTLKVNLGTASSTLRPILKLDLILLFGRPAGLLTDAGFNELSSLIMVDNCWILSWEESIYREIYNTWGGDFLGAIHTKTERGMKTWNIKGKGW